MGLIGTIETAASAFFFAIMAGFTSKVAADEFKAWSPRLAMRLVERAVRGLPASQRDRYREEWLSHLADTPGNLGRLLAAAGLLRAGRRMRAPKLRVFSWRWLVRPLKLERDLIVGIVDVIETHAKDPASDEERRAIVAGVRALVVTRHTLMIRWALVMDGLYGDARVGTAIGTIAGKLRNSARKKWEDRGHK